MTGRLVVCIEIREVNGRARLRSGAWRVQLTGRSFPLPPAAAERDRSNQSSPGRAALVAVRVEAHRTARADSMHRDRAFPAGPVRSAFARVSTVRGAVGCAAR